MAIIMAGGSPEFLNYVAFGPVFGPHIAFAGGVAAAAYAARQSEDVGGKDIGIALVSMDRPVVMVVGAVFGMFGYVVQTGIAAIPGFGGLTDSVALTVFISAIVVRLAIGRTSLTGDLPEGSGWGRFAPRDGVAWVRYHERFGQLTVLSLFVGLLAAGVALQLEAYYPNSEGTGQLLMFSVSAVSLLFLSLGISFPVTHHITIIAGLGALDVPADRRRQRGGRGTHRHGVRHALRPAGRGLRPGVPQQRQHPLRPSGRGDLADDHGDPHAGDAGRRRRLRTVRPLRGRAGIVAAPTASRSRCSSSTRHPAEGRGEGNIDDRHLADRLAHRFRLAVAAPGPRLPGGRPSATAGAAARARRGADGAGGVRVVRGAADRATTAPPAPVGAPAPYTGTKGDVHAEVLVLGAGPGGYTAAFRAADLGKQVVMIDSRGPSAGCASTSAASRPKPCCTPPKSSPKPRR